MNWQFNKKNKIFSKNGYYYFNMDKFIPQCTVLQDKEEYIFKICVLVDWVNSYSGT